MKYKNGDTVKIKSYQWYNANKDSNGDVHDCKILFNSTMSMYCGKEMTIEEVNEEEQFYYLYEDIEAYKWTDGMFEDDDFEFQRAIRKTVDECLWSVNDEIDVYVETNPTEKLVDDSVEFGKNVMKKKISEYLLKYLPLTPDDKESFVEEMNKNIK